MRIGRNHIFAARNISLMLVLATWLFAHQSYSQKITNVDFEVVDNTVKITYDVDDCSGDKNYDMKVLLGQDGKLTEITQGITGDTRNVPCGSSNTITWDVLSDREELRGRIYFAVEIQRVHRVAQEPPPRKTETEGKRWSRRSWKADKGYVGGSIGVFTPYETYSPVPYDLERHGLFLNATIGYLPSQLLGISSTIFIYGVARNDEFNIASWTNCGILVGPLISFPIGNKIKWEVRPQVGYSLISANSDHSDLDSLNTVTHGVAYNIGTGLRLNFGKRTCYLLNVEYMATTRKLERYRIEPEIGTLGVSFGVAFRFY